MKKMIRTFLLSILSCTIQLEAQVPHETQNLQKYWIYRERLKNHLINGAYDGAAIPAQGRSMEHKRLDLNDSPWNLSYWMGALAMEYDLLIKAGYFPSSPEVMQTKQDLYYVIEAVNRLDCSADAVWACSGVDCPTNSLNGFSLDDDVPEDFHKRLYSPSGKSGSDLLNESWVPPPDEFRIKCINSSGAQYVIPREVSVDHVAALFMGFVLVKKFIPPWETSTLPFTEHHYETNFVLEVQNIANRFITWIQSSSPHKWELRNLCEDRCVRGVCNPTRTEFCGTHPNELNPNASDEDPCPNLFDPCGITATTGANAKPAAIGLIAANEFIQGTPSTLLHSLIGDAFYRNAWSIDIGTIKPSPWKYTLLAIGDVGRYVEISPWPMQIIIGDSKKDIAKILVNDGVKEHWEHLILLNRLLYGTQYKNNGDAITIPDSYYECLLDAAPCRGYDGIGLSGVNAEWSNTDRLAGNRNGDFFSSFSRVDFLFYFNLYNEINSSYLGNNYTSIPIINLAKETIDKQNYRELDKKNFMAFSSITAHNNYSIDYDGMDRGRVTFVAGQVVDLKPGFSVGNGATFNAYIDPTIGKMSCIEPQFTDCGFLEENLRFESDSSDPISFDTLYITMQDTSSLRNSKEGIKEISNIIDLYITPNPSSGQFILQLKEEETGNVFIYNNLGQIIYQSATVGPQTAIDISSHPKGIYILKVQAGEKVYTEKLVVQ